MRHRKKNNHLGRTSSHRKAMLSNMAASLILHKRISTTTAKAKALRIYVEPLITKAKEDTTHSRRIVFSQLQNKEAVTELFREIAQKIADRPGGYTRILKTGNRLGDNADMCIIELVDYNENMLAAKEDSKAPAKRSRRGKKKPDASPAPVEAKSKTAKPPAEVPSAQAIDEDIVAENATDVVEPAIKEEVSEEPEAVKTETKEKKEDIKNEVVESVKEDSEPEEATEKPAAKKEKKPAARKKAEEETEKKKPEADKESE
jgi:large subunit ribosomal protein L17